MSVFTLSPAGPVAAAFTADPAFITAIMGPVGAGKTVACVAKCLALGMAQNTVEEPDGRGGARLVKRCRIAVVRDTYPNLDRTVIKTWLNWLPKGLGKWSGEAPRTHSFTVDGLERGPDGVTRRYALEMEMLFVAIGDNKVEDVLRGFEVTGLWLNEADLLTREVIEIGVGRVGRYPGAKDGGCRRSQIFCDFNAPDEDNWTYDLFVDRKIDEEVAANIRDAIGDQPLLTFHAQPGGREPGAENLHNLPPGYYAKQQVGMRADLIARMIDNKFGAVRNGMPVYPEFADRVHVAPERLEPLPGIPLRIGMDAGLTPAAVIGQRTAFGQMRVLAELAVFVDDADGAPAQMGPTNFGKALKDLLASRFPRHAVEFAAVDPAAVAGTDGSGNELSWLQMAAQASGLRIRPAPVRNNSLDIRLEAVRRPLQRLLEQGQPGLLISPDCRILRRGFNSGYVYRRTELKGGDGRYENKPVKNQFSHVHDALQYLMVSSGEGGLAEGMPKALRNTRAAKVTVRADYDPFA